MILLIIILRTTYIVMCAVFVETMHEKIVVNDATQYASHHYNGCALRGYKFKICVYLSLCYTFFSRTWNMTYAYLCETHKTHSRRENIIIIVKLNNVTRVFYYLYRWY